MSGFWQLSFDLGQLDPNVAEESCFNLGATSVTFVDAHDDPVLEPLPGEFRLWPSTRLRALFPDLDAPQDIVRALAETLEIPAASVQSERVEDRVWEREWL
jgi:ribosomal protein L11 methyltransferase